VIVTDNNWGPRTVLINNRKVALAAEKRHNIDHETFVTAHSNWIEIGYKEAQVKHYILPWAPTNYGDVYVEVPGQWKNAGMSGLCGNFNGNVNDDKTNVANGKQYWVQNTARSYFKNPNPRSMADIEADDTIFASEQEAQRDVIEQALATSGLKTPQASLNLKLAFKSEAQKKMVEEKCGKGVHGMDKKACEYDLLAGEPGGEALKAFQVAQIMDHEMLLSLCRVSYMNVPASRLSSDEHKEGFTVAFWFKQSSSSSEDERRILSRGSEFAVSTKGSQLVVRHGEMHCEADGAASVGLWTQISIAVSHKGSLTVYINGENSCHRTINDPPRGEFDGAPLLVLDPKGTVAPADGLVARLFYVPLTVESQDIKRYSNRNPPNDKECSVASGNSNE